MAPKANSSANIRLDKDVFQGRLQKTSSSHIDQDEYIRFSQGQGQHIRLGQDVFKTSCKNVFKISSRRLANTSSRHLQDVLQKCLQDIFKTYHQVKLFLFLMFLRRTVKMGYLQKHLPRSHFSEIYGQCTKFARVINILKF